MDWEKEARKRRTNSVYADWAERDNLPENDPIGDVEESNFAGLSKQTNVDPYVKDFKAWKDDMETYNKTMAGNLLHPKDKNLTAKKDSIPYKLLPVEIAGYSRRTTSCCSSPQKYINGIGGMKFYSCKNCGSDLGDC